jgi:hypothetical protein
MTAISNIWNHPKTSAASLLLGIVTIMSVLSEHGVTLGTVGTGSLVTLVSGIATALLGMLARDPAETQSSTGSTAKLGVWALILLMVPLPMMSACSGTTVAQDIVNWTPALESAVATVDSSLALLAPADAAILAAATAGFDAASDVLVAQAKAYLINPTAPALAQLQTAVVTLEQQVNSALLCAVKIVNVNSQQHVLNEINAVGTAVLAILALVQSISTNAALARMAVQSPIKLAAVLPYLNKSEAATMVAVHYGEPVAWARHQVAELETSEAHAGF